MPSKPHSSKLIPGVFWKGSPLHCLHPPRHWLRFVDDTFVTQQESHKQLFLDHINNIDLAIKFTVEGNQGNGAIPFLDTLVKPEADNSLSISVYKKPTHTEQYLQWDSHHNLDAKYSVIGTLTHREKQFALDLNSLKRKFNTLRRLYPALNTPTGLWTRSKVSLLPATGRKVPLNKTTQTKGTTVLVVTPQKGPSP